MEPFRVICETCRSRLKVRDAGAIGEIHACPKCGSMVLIVPPADWQAGAATAAVGITAASTVAATVAPFHEPDFAHVPPPSDDLADMFEAAACSIHKGDVPASTTADVTPVELPPPASPTPFAHSSYVLWTVAASAAVLIGGLAIAFWPGDGEANVQGSADTVAAAAVAPPTKQSSVDETTLPVDSAAQPPTEPHVAAKPIQDESDDVTIENESTPTDLPSETTSDSIVATDAEAHSLPARDSAVEAVPAPTESIDSDADAVSVLKFDPLDFDPSNLSLAGSTSQRSGMDRESITAESATSSVSDVDPADVGSADVDGAIDEPNDEIQLAKPLKHSASVRLGPMPRDAQLRDAAKDLAFELGSMQMAGVPLQRFIDTVSDISGAAITLDPTALQLAGVSPSAQVTVDQSHVSVDKLLQSTLTKYRLNLSAQGGHVTIHLGEAEKRSSRQFEFKDLVEAGEHDATALAELIPMFVAPQSWKNAGGAGLIEVNGTQVRIEQTKVVHHELLVFCERLRLARGLALKSRYPKEMVGVDSPYGLLDAKLSEPATFTFLPWTRLADVVRHWQETSGVTILVDWQRLADVELGPATPLACSAVDRNWREALDEILETPGLAWWAVDGRTIQITSADAINSIHRVEFYTLPDNLRDQFASPGALIESLRVEIEKPVNARAAAEHLQLHVDSLSGRLIARGTPHVHRYLTDRFAGQLAQ